MPAAFVRYSPPPAATADLCAFARTSSPTCRIDRSNAGQSSKCVAKIRSTVLFVHSGTATFNCDGIMYAESAIAA
jgi:hypothetical protein